MKVTTNESIYRSSGPTSKNNRRFHEDKNASYVLPNDQKETDRLFLYHDILFKFLKGNYLAPVEQNLEKGITVLDSGCGPGVWTTDMAKKYPKSTFHGIDISSVVPEDWKLKNTIYTSGNISEGLPYKDNYFDYIHQRLLVAGLTRNDWVNSMRNFYKALKPGGYIEFLDVNCPFYDVAPPCYKEISNTFNRILFGRGLVPNIRDELPNMVKEAGFINLTVIYKDFPLNYEEEEGRKLWENIFSVFEACSTELIKYNDNWKDLDDFNKCMEEMRREILTESLFDEYVIVYGQKPF